jgi:hypothetical protein
MTLRARALINAIGRMRPHSNWQPLEVDKTVPQLILFGCGTSRRNTCQWHGVALKATDEVLQWLLSLGPDPNREDEQYGTGLSAATLSTSRRSYVC